MPPIDTTALTAIFAWVWSQYGKTLTDITIKKVWEELRWEDRALAYAQKVQRLYGTMQILGQAKPVPLEGIYTAISLLDRPTAWRRYTIEEMEAEFSGRGSRYFHAQHREEMRRDGLDMVKRGDNLFILGKPGAGKTTFLKHIALRGVSGELDRVPIFVGLKQLSDSGLSVFDFVISEFDVCDFPDAAAYLDRLLKAGKAVLLFDGLDEVNVTDDERKLLIADVENFTRKYDQCQRLITCRLAANDYLFQGHTYVEMADFNDSQIREFVARWFSSDKIQRERRKLFLAELEKTESKGLRELARVPLLLALLCLGFEETLKLSSRRVELYEEALDALLKKWDSGRNIRRDEVYRDLTLKRKEGMLAQVAAETFDRAEYFIPGNTLARGFESYLSKIPDAPAEIDGEVVLRAIASQHGLFVERARGIYSFAHLTFQEFFAARYVVENEARGTLPRLFDHYDDPRYREVFLLTAAQLPDATAFFDLLIERLAADAQQRLAVAALLRQAAHKAASASGGSISVTAIRSVYIFLARVHDRSLVKVFENAFENYIESDPVFVLDEDLDLDQDMDLESDFVVVHGHDRTRHSVYSLDVDPDRDRVFLFDLRDALDLDLARNLARDLDFDFDLARSLVRDLDLDLGRVRVFDYHPLADLALDIALANARVIIEFGINWPHDAQRREFLVAGGELLAVAATQAQAMGDSKLEQKLAILAGQVKPRDADSLPADGDRVKEELDAILESNRLIFPIMDEEDRNLLYKYLNGNLLLLECLDQAVVADRQTIKERLLLLPEEKRIHTL